MKISEAFNLYIRDYLELKGVDKHQIWHYKALGRYARTILGDIELEDLKIEDVALFQTKLRTFEVCRCNNTMNNYVSSFRMVLKYWRRRGLDCLDYTLIPVPKRDPVIPSFLTAAEVSKIIASTDITRTKLIVSLLYSSGIRVSELTQLNRDAIKNRQFTVVGKGRKPRICFIDARTEIFLKEYLNKRKDRLDALITTKDGTRASNSTIQLIIRNATEKADLKKKVSPHTFRHSFATNFIENNGNVRYLAALLGHSNIQTTAHYTHIVNGDLKKIYQKFHSI